MLVQMLFRCCSTAVLPLGVKYFLGSWRNVDNIFLLSCLYLLFILVASCSILNFSFFVTHLFLEIGVNNLGLMVVILVSFWKTCIILENCQRIGSVNYVILLGPFSAIVYLKLLWVCFYIIIFCPIRMCNFWKWYITNEIHLLGMSG